jgi:hypothetical protein
LQKNPVIAYLADDFQKPYPFRASVVVNVEGVLDKIVNMLDCHESQFYEWLPYNGGYLDLVPNHRALRRSWLAERVKERLRKQAFRFREVILQNYGQSRGAAIDYVEAFEGCEYGAPLDEAAQRRLFPFVG